MLVVRQKYAFWRDVRRVVEMSQQDVRIRGAANEELGGKLLYYV